MVYRYNESLRRDERTLAFNVQELKRLAAASIHRHESDIKDFQKLAEGGFNRVFEITMKDDNTRILARLPYPSTVPKRLAVASEVATLDLLRCHDIPVPKVLGYSANTDNSVGAEYILLEKVNGTPLGLPASGSIYYCHDLPPELKNNVVNLSHSFDFPNGCSEICIGPDASLAWWYAERSLLGDINRGPHLDAAQCMEAVANKELAWLKSYAKPRFPFERAYREATNYQKSAPEEYIEILEQYLKIVPYLIPKDKGLQRPILRHPDLQPNNIFVNQDLDIVGLIDWQYCSALPLFLAAGIPDYIQNYNDEESLRFTPPKLSDSLDEMSPHGRSAALEQFRRRHLHFYYLGFTQRFNPCHFNALDSDSSHLLKRKTFTHAAYPWEGNNAQLKADLVHVVQNWGNVVACTESQRMDNADRCTPKCPVKFDPLEAQDVLRIEKEYEEMENQLSRIRDAIGVSADGWTSTETFDDAVARAHEFKIMAIGSVSDNKFDQEMTEKHWPFDDFDENE
ncbi:hypothetical protein LOZ57_006594 [Ophidiomyces ophidiicola]|uniref:uncharacterized protein n=1 Tax=Ophidiomyces ophidiicola TaxID=1387563 RepID=UPI0020C43302|nr:uncharacterized protein LOZ57_006594 [Ophidiomyces ophidiicola]KAI1937474.1 hypothetical protein LOZ57_006594 [Ophidiomyces ophidiicola]KAI2057189.1 hypothetical protein LOZ43_003261 [Ophidiomyces ophidiicola]KAI2084696.1 hypothetical protein LOZ36_004578 [Ophidiomyces ophidiicola]